MEPWEIRKPKGGHRVQRDAPGVQMGAPGKPKGSPREPTGEPGAQEGSQGAQGGPQRPNGTPQELQREAKGSSREPQRSKWESQGRQKGAHGRQQEGQRGSKREQEWEQKEPGREHEPKREYVKNLRKPYENPCFQRSEEPGVAQSGTKAEAWEVRQRSREPWARPSGQSGGPEGPVSTQMEAQGPPRTRPDAEMVPQRHQVGTKWKPKGVQRLAKESRRGGKWSPGANIRENLNIKQT